MKRFFGKSSIVVGVAVLALAAAASPALARIPLAQLRAHTSSWRQVETLVRARAGKPAAGGFDFHPTLHLKTASGYRVEVISAGSAVAMIVGRRHGGAFTAYLARGVATSRRLKASFGRFGKIDMRFHPSPHVRPLHPPPHRCHGILTYPQHRGTWAGSFHFTGEGNYVSIRIHRAAGSIRRTKPVCLHLFTVRKRRSTAVASGPFSAFSLRKELVAGWRHGLESLEFAGVDTPFGTLFISQSIQALGSVSILRIALAISKPGSGDLNVNEALTHAEVKPPTPFHGVGTYSAAPDGTATWLGDLSVNFPGSPGLPLTGDQFKVEVKRPL